MQRHHVDRLPVLPVRGEEMELAVIHHAVGDTIEGWADAELSALTVPGYAELAEAILDAVVDTHELLIRDGRAGFIVTKRRTRG